MCSNAFDDFTDFEVCGFTKTQESEYLESITVSSNTKIHSCWGLCGKNMLF